MTIKPMHEYWRLLAQEAGMQNVLAILPEQIDMFINMTIVNTVRGMVEEKAASNRDRVLNQNAKLGQINDLKNLYKVKDLDMLNATTPAFLYNSANYITGLYRLNPNFNFPKYMYLYDFSVTYTRTTKGWVNNTPPVKNTTDAFNTSPYPVRLIEDNYLSDTLNDYISKPKARSPIIVAYSNEDKQDTVLDLYFGKTSTDGRIETDLAPSVFRVSYIAYPATVKYAEDLGGTNVDCDLPEYLHMKIIQDSVDLYNTTMGNQAPISRNNIVEAAG